VEPAIPDPESALCIDTRGGELLGVSAELASAPRDSVCGDRGDWWWVGRAWRPLWVPRVRQAGGMKFSVQMVGCTSCEPFAQKGDNR